MHEWALAEAVISTVDKVYKENNEAQVKAVNVFVGELQAVEMDIFSQGLKVLLAGYPFNPEVFRLQIEKASFKCNYCEEEWLLDDHTELGAEEKEAIHFLPETAHVYMRCPFCKSPDFKLHKGRGVYIGSIELETDHD